MAAYTEYDPLGPMPKPAAPEDQIQKLLRVQLRMAAHQLRMGQALVILLGGGTAGGDPKEFILDRLGEQNYALECAVIEAQS
jgi:hypothetical protein